MFTQCMDEEYMKCSCGSGEYKYPLRDGYGIFLTYACEKCEEEKMSGYRSDINEQYECNEPIEPEDPSDLR